MLPLQLYTQSSTATSSLCLTIVSFTWISRTSKFMLIWHRRNANATCTPEPKFNKTFCSVCLNLKEHRSFYLLFIQFENKHDRGGEEDGDQADTQTQDPIVAEGQIELQGGEDGTPQHHVQKLREGDHAPEVDLSTLRHHHYFFFSFS